MQPMHRAHGIPAQSGDGHGGPTPPKVGLNFVSPSEGDGTSEVIALTHRVDKATRRFVRLIRGIDPKPPRWNIRRGRWEDPNQFYLPGFKAR